MKNETRTGLPPVLYHATHWTRLPSIVEHGLRPRGDAPQVRDVHLPSDPELVHLTTASALYFAGTIAQDNEPLAIVEINTTKIAEKWLESDTEVVAEIDPDHIGGDFSELLLLYAERSKEISYSWRGSLSYMGTCAFRGTIRPSALSRILLLMQEDDSRCSRYLPAGRPSYWNYRRDQYVLVPFTAWLFNQGQFPGVCAQYLPPGFAPPAPPQFPALALDHKKPKAALQRKLADYIAAVRTAAKSRNSPPTLAGA